MAPRCVWCNGTEGQLIEVEAVVRNEVGLNPRPRQFTVHPGCHQEFREFADYALKYTPVVIVAFIGLTLLMMVGAFWQPKIIPGLLFLMAVVIWKFPFATPQTVEAVGLKTSIFLARLGGVLVLITGFATAFLLW
ncbi:MAG: hypothetical protein D6681_16105 [Calditrichaeota bacterium]|nr:MAG: hypothetical protein D6681_16105 [Calditrichota bacterium]